MRQCCVYGVAIAILLVEGARVDAGRPVIVSVTHEASFQNLDDYPEFEFFLAPGRGWQPVKSGVATWLNIPIRKGVPVHLYAIPKQEIAPYHGNPPVEWMVNPPAFLKESAEAMPVRYEEFIDYDVIGQFPGRDELRRGALAANFFDPAEDPPGAHGPIVPYRYLAVFRVTVQDQLHLQLVSEEIFDKRGNVIEPDGAGKYRLAFPWATGIWAVVVLVGLGAVSGIFLIIRARRSSASRVDGLGQTP